MSPYEHLAGHMRTLDANARRVFYNNLLNLPVEPKKEQATALMLENALDFALYEGDPEQQAIAKREAANLIQRQRLLPVGQKVVAFIKVPQRRATKSR